MNQVAQLTRLNFYKGYGILKDPKQLINEFVQRKKASKLPLNEGKTDPRVK